MALVAVLAASGCSLYGNNQTSAPRPAPVTEQPPTPAPGDDSGAINPANTPPVTTPDDGSGAINPVTAKSVMPENNSSAVNIKSFSFNPSVITIKKGATITWTNDDSAPHTIKSAAFSSDTLSQGQNFSFTFNQAGTFSYFCSIHPAMTGRIIVE